MAGRAMGGDPARAGDEPIHQNGAASPARLKALEPSLSDTFTARLYWAGPGQEFDPERSLSSVLDAAADRQRVRFDLPPGAGDVERIRFEPGAGTGYMHLYRAAILGSGPPGPVLWELTSVSEIAANAVLSGMRLSTALIGEVLLIESGAAAIELRLPGAPFALDGAGMAVEIEFDHPKSTDFLIAKDGFLAERDGLLERIRRLESRLADLQGAREELEMIRRSRVWRLAERLRVLFYVRLLGLVPPLQKALLGLTRRRLNAGGAAPAAPGARPAPLPGERPYDRWRKAHALTPARRAEIMREIEGFTRKPRISVVMPVYNADPAFLEAAIASVQAQLYENWELCIVDDRSSRDETLDVLRALNEPRIKVRYLAKNKNIAGATNEAIRMAGGEYFALMDNDDEMSPEALYQVVRAINASDPELVYTDEDFIDHDGRYVNPHFKPDFSPDLLLSHNYITHLLVVGRGLLERIGPLDSAYDGAQDYDLVLRATEATDRIVHLPRVLYHWRMSASSTSFDADAKPQALDSARRALQAALDRRGIDAVVRDGNIPHFFRVKRAIPQKDPPLVSVIIPFRDKPELLRMCLGSILEKSTYACFEVIGISNNSEGVSTFSAMREFEKRDPRIRFYEHNIPFSFSKLINFGASKARGEHLLLLNNDIEILSWDWIEAMLEHSQRAEVGVVGAKLYYPDNTVQHAGIIIGIGGYAGHAHKHFDSFGTGYFNRLHVIQNVSAVTGACMMVKRSVFEEVGGFDEESFGVACNDVDFCLRVKEKGYLNVFTPYAEAYHHESLSRGYEDTPEKQARFDREKAHFSVRHENILRQGDPYYNPNLSLDTESFDIRI
jgi:GT2 family glycosyltransferase